MEALRATPPFKSFRPILVLMLALGLAACDEKPPSPHLDDATGAASQTPDRAGEPATGQPAPDVVRPVPAPSADESPLAQKVKSALAADPQVNALEIDVVAAQGVVTLYGTASTRASRERAARVASGIEGVKSVDNKLAVVAGS